MNNLLIGCVRFFKVRYHKTQKITILSNGIINILSLPILHYFSTNILSTINQILADISPKQNVINLGFVFKASHESDPSAHEWPGCSNARDNLVIEW